jgi:hypothetical protein
VTRHGLALTYGSGALACAVVGALVRGWGRLLFWPAASLAAVAFGYAAGWCNLFFKRRGRLPLWVRVFHGPYLLGHWISWRLQSVGRPASSELTSGVWIGRRLGRCEAAGLERLAGDVTVVDLTAEMSETASRERYVNLPVLDLTLPDLRTLRRIVRAIDGAVMGGGGGVYVHCALGYGRSAVVAAAYLLHAGLVGDVDQAMARVRACRAGSVFSLQAQALLSRFALNIRSRQGARGSAAPVAGNFSDDSRPRRAHARA